MRPVEDEGGLAVERTALSWQRTGLAHMATGAATLRLLPTSPLRPVVAVTMILVGVAATVGGRRLQPGQPHRRWILALGASTAVAAAVVVLLTIGDPGR